MRRHAVLGWGCLVVVAMLAGCRQSPRSGCSGGSCPLRSGSYSPGASSYSSEPYGVSTAASPRAPAGFGVPSGSLSEGSGTR